ncbi:MAG TPA: hypothetical protein PK286_12925 [Devosia sp.]|nr:hypothetical protein [Devosia sp.]
MLFLLSLAGFVLVPFALLAALPMRLGTAMVGGLMLAALAFGLATAGTEFPMLPVSLIVSGAISGLLTGGIWRSRREHDAPWHEGAVTLAAGAAACVPVWFAMSLGTGMLIAGMNG